MSLALRMRCKAAYRDSSCLRSCSEMEPPGTLGEGGAVLLRQELPTCPPRQVGGPGDTPVQISINKIDVSTPIYNSVAVGVLTWYSLRLDDIYRQENLIRPLLGLTDELLALNQRAITNFTHDPLPSEAIDWFTEVRQRLCHSIGLSAKDSYDKLIHKCLTKGGPSYMQEQ